MENKKKTIKLGDTFCIKPICFEYYDVNNEGNTKCQNLLLQ